MFNQHKDQTLETRQTRCSSCKVMAFYTYTCTKCKLPICEDCYPKHKTQCTLKPTHQSPSSSSSTTSSTSSIYKYKCSICDKRELQRIVCPDCKQQFCLSHRKQFSHNCPKSPQVIAAGRAKPSTTSQSSQTTQTTMNVNVSGQSSIQWIMRLQQPLKNERLQKFKQLTTNAIGDKQLPTKQRWFSEVMLPSGKIMGIFLNGGLTMKQAIKDLCRLCQLESTSALNTMTNEQLAKKYSFLDFQGDMINMNKQINQLNNYTTLIVLLN